MSSTANARRPGMSQPFTMCQNLFSVPPSTVLEEEQRGHRPHPGRPGSLDRFRPCLLPADRGAAARPADGHRRGSAARVQRARRIRAPRLGDLAAHDHARVLHLRRVRLDHAVAAPARTRRDRRPLPPHPCHPLGAAGGGARRSRRRGARDHAPRGRRRRVPPHLRCAARGAALVHSGVPDLHGIRADDVVVAPACSMVGVPRARGGGRRRRRTDARVRRAGRRPQLDLRVAVRPAARVRAPRRLVRPSVAIRARRHRRRGVRRHRGARDLVRVLARHARQPQPADVGDPRPRARAGLPVRARATAHPPPDAVAADARRGLRLRRLRHGHLPLAHVRDGRRDRTATRVRAALPPRCCRRRGGRRVRSGSSPSPS